MEETKDEGIRAVNRQAISGEIIKEPQPDLSLFLLIPHLEVK